MFDGMPNVSKRTATNIDIHIGARVRERRMVLGWSQEKLADTLDLTFQQIQKYEKGANRIGAGRLLEIAQLLGVPISYFYDDIDGAKLAAPTSPITEMLKTRDGVELANAFCRITDANKRRLLICLAQSLCQAPAESSN